MICDFQTDCVLLYCHNVFYQFTLDIEDCSYQGPPFPTFTAIFDEQAPDNFRFADVDRLLIRNFPVTSLSKWVHGEVDLANRRVVAQSDPVVRQSVMIISSPIMIMIEQLQKDRFSAAISQVTNRTLATSDDPLRFLASDGPRRTHIGDVIESFRVAGIDTVTALSFGQKARLQNYTWLADVVVGGNSGVNTVVELDVGVNSEPIAGHESSVIVVRDRNVATWPGSSKHYPMFWELANAESADRPPFGTFRLSSTSDPAIKQVGRYQL